MAYFLYFDKIKWQTNKITIGERKKGDYRVDAHKPLEYSQEFQPKMLIFKTLLFYLFAI